MASIRFVIEASDSNKRDLAGLLEDDKVLDVKGKELVLDMVDVDEGLARWLMGSLIAHHGLRPSVSGSTPTKDPAPAPINRKARDEGKFNDPLPPKNG